MGVVLEVKAGPAAGKRVSVMNGQTMTIGRAADRANFALPHDTFMSGLHFAVECGSNGCKLTDRKSSNGTFVNGTRVAEIFLNNGDEVRSGQTVFAVRMIVDEAPAIAASPARPATKLPPAQPPIAPLPQPPVAPRGPSIEPLAPPFAPQPEQAPSPGPRQTSAEKHFARDPVKKASAKAPALAIGGWSFSTVPEGWEAQGEYGMQRSAHGGFPSSAVVSEESLSVALRDYVEAQLSTLRQYLREPQIEAVLPPQISGAEETIAVEVCYKAKDGQALFYQRVYARAGGLVGVLTFTTLYGQLATVRPEFDTILTGASFTPKPAATA